MGADAFFVTFGVRFEVDAQDEANIELLELHQHPTQIKAKDYKLQTWWGKTTDESKYFLLVGRIIGQFGRENSCDSSISVADSTRIAKETSLALRAAGFEGPAAWHFQFEPDY